ncbi:hypothetical protein [Nocardia otitidiscaviarum]|uniref:hypothetical protein n=1 Tax=Nocardia otitidiscaviarum TaxID=1823 RepID=UPI0011DE10D3|nr:hypothetical protein [Nocardia otitidiscaviarum]
MAQIKRGVRHVDIAQQFAVSAELISRIATGKGYANVTGLGKVTGHAAGCRACELGDTRERNIETARAALVEVMCVFCHDLVSKPVGVVLNARGSVRCDTHNGRIK